MPDPAPIRVVIADPVRLMVAGLGLHVADAGDLALVGSARDAAALWPLLDTTPCDVLMINAPALGGVDLLRELVTRYPRAVLLCTALLKYTAALRAGGARGYGTMSESAAVVMETIRAVARGTWVRSPLAEDGRQWYLDHGEPLTPAQVPAALGGLRREAEWPRPAAALRERRVQTRRTEQPCAAADAPTQGAPARAESESASARPTPPC